MTETKQIGGEFFTRIEETNAWFESNQKGEPIFNRGEVEVAEQIWKAFRDWEVRVTIGPYRFYDIRFEIRDLARVIEVDLYSVRPGLQYVKDCIEEMREKIALMTAHNQAVEAARCLYT